MGFTSAQHRVVFLIVLAIIAVASGAALVWYVTYDVSNIALQLITGIIFTLAVAMLMWLILDPDTHAARQSDELLKLASEMLNASRQGLTPEAAQQICELLLPATPAIAVAITDREVILGYAGYNAANNQPGRPIRTTATKETLLDGQPRILHRTDEIGGLPMSSARINAAIVQPLYIGRSIEGTLKFYYRRATQISQTQESVAHGFAELLSTQMAASALEEQVKLTTSMELKALQAQINPHFLFNTINTIASLIRTDPAKARVLLRDFASYYRSTLEDADDLIKLERELKQIERYISFEVARFGEDRLQLEIEVDPAMYDMKVPSFLIQPIVENAVKHAMRAEGQLVIQIFGCIYGENIIINVADNGIGMDAETLQGMMVKESDTGLGIAVKNVKDRINGYFGPESKMEVTSVLGAGTVVTFTLNRAIAEGRADSYLDID
ncbi:MAG: histidine kinase [Eggerthellaceae bacterium]|nr:histidine kinase [Eggerthellaceae bacterium]